MSNMVLIDHNLGSLFSLKCHLTEQVRVRSSDHELLILSHFSAIYLLPKTSKLGLLVYEGMRNTISTVVSDFCEYEH